MKREFTYPLLFTAEADAGGWVVTSRDLPEVVTQGETLDEALEAAEGAVEAAVEMRIADGLEIPPPTARCEGERSVSLPVTTAMKAALYLTLREQNISKSQLAKHLGLDEKAARRMLDPRHPSKIPALQQALSKLGRHVELTLI